MLSEGRGYLLHHGVDTPLAGWLGIRALDAACALPTAPWRALAALGGLADVFPGGLALVWDGPAAWLQDMDPETRTVFLDLLFHLPGTTLHAADPVFFEDLEGPVQAWFHAQEPPQGRAGQAWRQGWFGWTPGGMETWDLPGLGRAEVLEGRMGAGALWGEVVLPFGALKDLNQEMLLRDMGDTQARLERSLSQRIAQGAWPALFPFQRRRTGWRLALLGGREYRQGGGSWEEALGRVQALGDAVRAQLKCPVHIGPCDDAQWAALLGHQAMREGLPWRYSLPLPPASPVFSTGFSLDPRTPGSLEGRASGPEGWTALLTDPPVAWLRVPTPPGESAVAAFLRGLAQVPALHWLPPGVPPRGPFLQEHPWTPAANFPPLPDVSRVLPQSLFEVEELP